MLSLLRRPGSAAARAYRDAARVPAGTPWREASFCVVDLELTGLDPRQHEIVSWGAVCVEGGRVVCGTAAEGLARPERGVPAEAVRIHGLRPADLADAPPLAEALDGLLQVMTGRVLVAHAAWVERASSAARCGHGGCGCGRRSSTPARWAGCGWPGRG